MKNTLMALGIVAVVIALLLGFPRILAFIQIGRDKFPTPVPVSLKELDILLDQERSHIAQYQGKVSVLQMRAEGEQKTIEKLKGNVEEESRLLATIKALLEEHKASYDIGGQSYSYAQVSRDALLRLERLKEFRENMAFHQEIHDDLARAVQDGQTSLEEAGRKFSELQRKREQLEIENANADMKAEVARLTTSLTKGSFRPNSELERRMAAVEEEVQIKFAQAGSSLGTVTAPLINYTAAGGPNVTAQIDRALSELNQPQPAPAERAAAPGLIPSAALAMDALTSAPARQAAR